MSVIDPNRLGAGRHSYGTFMTANLVAHSDSFRAGIARSWAYKRTLTPFGSARESVEDVLAEMLNWFHRFRKSATPRETNIVKSAKK